MANMCLASRKDFRNAVTVARSSQKAWQGRTAYNKAQIVYRIAEMLQQREALFLQEMLDLGMTKAKAKNEFDNAVDLLVYYAGWCDKYTQIYSSVNPVASSHFNFSVPEPMGIVASMAVQNSPLVGLIQATIPPVCGGNTVVVLASEQFPTSAISFAEVLATSDVPGGIINILTGERSELQAHFSSHMDVNAMTIWNGDSDMIKDISVAASENVKRIRSYPVNQLDGDPDLIMDLQETKTTWHPIENISGSGSGY